MVMVAIQPGIPTLPDWQFLQTVSLWVGVTQVHGDRPGPKASGFSVWHYADIYVFRTDKQKQMLKNVVQEKLKILV